MRSFISIALLTLAAMLSSCRSEGDFCRSELRLISSSDTLMRVLTVRDSSDIEILRAKSRDLSAGALRSKAFRRLSSLMLSTVTHPSQDGVGIAAPQVGINRRVVAVQRFDKTGEPFEIYPNIRIIWTADSLSTGPEGCLSVPDMRGDVARSTSIIIEYTDLNYMKTVRDTVSGFTAVIFQHETDHLDGILYTDRIRMQQSEH